LQFPKSLMTTGASSVPTREGWARIFPPTTSPVASSIPSREVKILKNFP
jgi:hypothetical protein